MHCVFCSSSPSRDLSSLALRGRRGGKNQTKFIPFSVGSISGANVKAGDVTPFFRVSFFAGSGNFLGFSFPVFRKKTKKSNPRLSEKFGVQCVTGYLSRYFTQFDTLAVNEHHKNFCKVVPHLNKRQREICNKNSDLVRVIGDGVKDGVSECQYQFRYQKWNCSTFRNDPTLFGKSLVRGGHEMNN